MTANNRKRDDGIHLYIDKIGSEEEIKHQLNDIIERIPYWRKKKALSYKYDIDKYLCAKSFLLLKEGLSYDYKINDEILFSYNSYGKPFLTNHPEIHFNFSHCKKGVACAISSNSPVGVDIEEIIYDDDIARHILRKDDYKNVIKSPNKAESFTKLWTEKESYLKMLGCGLLDNMQELNTEIASFFTKIEREDGYVVTLCQIRNDNHK